jgi:hypothetical protein
MYTIDANGLITRLEDGVRIVRDILSKDYQDFLHFERHGVYLPPAVAPTSPTPTAPVAAPKEEVVIAPKITPLIASYETE